MEERYGGAEEATDLVYKSLKQQLEEAAASEDSSDTSRVAFMPIHWRILTMAYLKVLSDDYSVEYSRLRSNLYHKFTWKTSDVQQALNDLVNQGYLTQVLHAAGVHRQGEGRVREPDMGPSRPLDNGRYGEVDHGGLHPDPQGPGVVQDEDRALEDGRREACAGDREAAEGASTGPSATTASSTGASRAWRCPTSGSSSPPPRRSRTSSGTTRR